MKVVLVHDYLTQRGGAERVLLTMAKIFPGAPIVTAAFDPAATFPEFRDLDVRPLWPDRFRGIRRDHRRGLVAYPFAFHACHIDADAVLCSTSGFAHGVRTSGRKVVYCYNPPRWLYQPDEYLAGASKLARPALAVLAAPLRRWDVAAAKAADLYLTTSRVVQARILDAYGRESRLIPPPVMVEPTGARRRPRGVPDSYLLVVARSRGYKNTAVAVNAAQVLGQPIVVVGSPPPERPLPHNVHWTGWVDEDELRWLYANARLLVAASYEDFGLTPLEANAFGVPAVALRAGGYLDTVSEGVNGVFFDTATPHAVAGAVAHGLRRSWDVSKIRDHAASYSVERFSERLRRAVGGDGML
ncbi:MAG TPA: glycosyltransferase [Mycobacteriales bacterium]|nr:glycosyltransferase [Mycobacteriales bacterium]